MFLHLHSYSVKLSVACLLLGTIAWGQDSDTNNNASQYAARQTSIHNLVRKRIAPNILDSLSGINHSLLDSLRVEIIKHKDKDSISILKTTLDYGMKDSLVIIQVKNLLNAVSYTKAGAINAHCIDIHTQVSIDSVKMSIYRQDSLIATSYTAGDGFCIIANLKPGQYSITFSKNNYTSFTDCCIKVTSGNSTYILMPLVKLPGVLSFPFSIYTWLIVGASAILPFVLMYVIMRTFVKPVV